MWKGRSGAEGSRTLDLLNAMCLTTHLRGPMHGYLRETASGRQLRGATRSYHFGS
jgi:hypothetical protein